MFYSLNIDKGLREFLIFCVNSGVSKIANIITRDEFILPIGDFIKVEDEVGIVSYIPKSKIPSIIRESGFDHTKYRTKIRIGRLVTKLIKKNVISDYNVSGDDVELFVNLFKSYFDSDTSKLTVVEGEEVLKWYLDYNYKMINDNRCVGTLWSSCMRYSDKNKFMQLYSDNPDKIKMLIKLDGGKLIARALLWEDCEDSSGNKYKVMDRIYTVYDHDVITFKMWGKENGYLPKSEQSSRSERYFDTINGQSSIKLTTKLDVHKHTHYPYLDTFKFYDSENGVFSNQEMSFRDFVLIQGNGSMCREEVVEDGYEDNEDDF